MTTEIKLLLIDDHSLFRESLSRLLATEPGFSVSGTYASAKAALDAPELDQVSVVLLDYDLGEEHGGEFLTWAESRGFQGRVLLVTAGMSDAAMARLLDSGASGIFLKHSPPARLVEAIRSVAAGGTWLDPRVARSVLSAVKAADAEPSARPLTKRERDVLHGVFEGLANKEIGAQLEISESSVKAVLQQLFDKTGVRTRGQLVRIALEKHADDWLA